MFKAIRRFSSLPAKPTLKPNELVLESLAEAKFFSQHRPLCLGLSSPTGTFETLATPLDKVYIDEYSRLFNTFPLHPPFDEQPFSQQMSSNLRTIEITFDPFQPNHQQEYKLISIMKRRRKKMNKHKWKKMRRAVRNSSRYNKEKLRKKGTIRKKQE